MYIFDVDGTLTPSRGQIDNEFKQWFLRFIDENPVALVTGSDLEKTVEQVGPEIVSKVEYSFNCSGNAIYKNNELIYKNEWRCPDDLWLFLEDELYKSHYTERYGIHFEERIGMLNFSVVGRGAKGDQRDKYYQWDRINGERERISNAINTRWPNIKAVVGGETGIDIFQQGGDKSQILRYIPEDVKIHFYGDRMDPVGNDYPLAKAINEQKRGVCYHVKDWRDTWRTLQAIETIIV